MKSSGADRFWWPLRLGAGLILLVSVAQPARADCVHPAARWADNPSRLGADSTAQFTFKFGKVLEEQTGHSGSPIGNINPAITLPGPSHRGPCPAGFRCGPPTHDGAPPPPTTTLQPLDPLATLNLERARPTASSLWPATGDLYTLERLSSIEHPPRTR